MSEHSIFIKGARVNNLKNIDVEIPRDRFIVITGLCRKFVGLCKAIFGAYE